MFQRTKTDIAASEHLARLQHAARDYLDRGWSVIPLTGKLPLVAWKEFQTRRPTSAEVGAWFAARKQPPTGLAIVTGKLSGLVVVDCDSAEDAAFWQATYPTSSGVVATGGGGVHFYYRPSPAAEVRNRTRVLGRRIDLRGEGGYAVAPPSVHASGKRYAWVSSDPAVELPVFSWDWVAEPPRSASPPSGRGGRVRNAVSYLRRIHAVAGEGGHNATFRAACKLREAGLSQEEALAVLSEWNETNATPPWSAAELAHKIKSAFAR